jgi:hypothetical protein
VDHTGGYDHDVSGDKVVRLVLDKVATRALCDVIYLKVAVRVVSHSATRDMLNIQVLMEKEFMFKLVGIKAPFHVCPHRLLGKIG